jgi:hypothetical protein
MDDSMAGFLTYGLQHSRLAFPEQRSSGINNELPADNSCGHSRGILLKVTAFPFTPKSGHHRWLKLRRSLGVCNNHPPLNILFKARPSVLATRKWLLDMPKHRSVRCPQVSINASLAPQSLLYSPLSLHRTPIREPETV